MDTIYPQSSNGPEVESAARRIVRELRSQSDPVRAKGVQNYFKNAIVSLGMPVPAVRLYVRGELKRLKTSWSLRQGIALCELLLAEEEMEIRMSGILLVSGFKKEFTPELLIPAKHWLASRLDNWALVDLFCGVVLSPLMQRHPTTEETLRAWSGDPTMWVRRASLVTLVPFARRGEHLDLVYRLAGEHFWETEDLMHKATGWLLREAGKTDMHRLRQFLCQHGPAIPRTTLRYAIERYPTDERQELLRITRG